MLANRHQQGFTLLELLIASILSAIILVGVGRLLQTSIGTEAAVIERNQLTQDARFAMERMVRTAQASPRLLLPLADNPGTNWPENIRDETVPPSPPIGDSVLATAVFAVTLPLDVDLDADGVPDADDDGDGLFDEDLPNDSQHDFYPGIMLIDDDGDGFVDEGAGWAEDDEDGSQNEDPLDGIDNDGDGSIDEDPPSDNNLDGCPGRCGVDDDSDGTIDEGDDDNDDEQSSSYDDPYDPVVFYLDNGRLIERMPVPWNEDGISTPDGPVDGRDFVTSVIADNVTRFRVERVAGASATLARLLLELTGPSGAVVIVETDVRIGGLR